MDILAKWAALKLVITTVAALVIGLAAALAFV